MCAVAPARGAEIKGFQKIGFPLPVFPVEYIYTLTEVNTLLREISKIFKRYIIYIHLFHQPLMIKLFYSELN
jgi:hypothetical protein